MFTLDTEITMADGEPVELGLITPLDEVMGDYGIPDVVESIHRAVRDVSLLRFADHSELRATPDAVMVINGEWQRAETLKPVVHADEWANPWGLVERIDGGQVQLFERFGDKRQETGTLRLRRQRGFFANGFLVHDG